MQYLFRWDNIPGKDDRILKEFLKKKFDIDWAINAKFKKIDNNKTIKLSTEKNSLTLKLNDKKTEVILDIEDCRRDEFIVRRENGELCIYLMPNDCPKSMLNRPKGLHETICCILNPFNPFREAQFKRLEWSIISFKNDIQFENNIQFKKKYNDKDHDIAEKMKIMVDHLKSAECYFREGNIDVSWRCLNKAIMQSLFLLDEKKDIEIINAKRQSVLKEATEKVTSKWRKETIQKILSDESWNSEKPNGHSNNLKALKEAYEILYEHYDNVYYKKTIFANQLITLSFIGFILILLLLFLSPPMDIPIKNIINETCIIDSFCPREKHSHELININNSYSNSTLKSTNKNDEKHGDNFLIFVAIFGALGATISGFMSVARRGIESRITEQSDIYWIILTKLVVGMGCALAIFAFIAAGIITFRGEMNSGFIFAISFVAGFSERFVESAVEKVASK